MKARVGPVAVHVVVRSLQKLSTVDDACVVTFVVPVATDVVTPGDCTGVSLAAVVFCCQAVAAAWFLSSFALSVDGLAGLALFVGSGPGVTLAALALVPDLGGLTSRKGPPRQPCLL